MKRIILSIFVLIFGFSVQAQGVDLGLKLGANFSNFSDASGLDFESKTGFVAGAFLGIKFNDKFAIQPELLYSQQGAKLEVDDFNLNYVNVPVIIKYYLVQGLNVQLGPQFGFVVDDNVVDAIGEGIDTNNFDTSGVVGLGYDFPFGLRLDARYNFGLTEVADNAGKNSVISLALGFSFL